MSGAAPSGRLITFEGIDGAGKSTQARRLAEGRPGAVLTREPGGSDGAEAIRALLVEGAPDRWSPEVEMLLFTAARRDHVERVIAPALMQGHDVICDRFVDSTRVYQGVVRSGLRAIVDALHERIIGREPDLTLILDADPHAALGRSGSTDRFEKRGADFLVALRQGYLDLAAAFPERCHVVDAMQPADTVAAEIARIAA